MTADTIILFIIVFLTVATGFDTIVGKRQYDEFAKIFATPGALTLHLLINCFCSIFNRKYLRENPQFIEKVADTWQWRSITLICSYPINLAFCTKLFHYVW